MRADEAYEGRLADRVELPEAFDEPIRARQTRPVHPMAPASRPARWGWACGGSGGALVGVPRVRQDDGVQRIAIVDVHPACLLQSERAELPCTIALAEAVALSSSVDGREKLRAERSRMNAEQWIERHRVDTPGEES